MKTGVEALRGIRYKLRMMGVPLTGPTYIYGDNMSVISRAKANNYNRCIHGLGHIIRIVKTKYMQTYSAVVFVMS